MKKINLIGLIVFLLSGCMREYPGNQESEELATADIPAANKEANAISQKLVKTASTRFQVADINKSLNEILRIVAKYPGDVADSRMASSTSRTEHRLSVRIPPSDLDRFLSDLDSQSIFTEFRNIITTDVTKEFIDLESRLKTKKDVHDRLKEILRTRTGSIEDVLAAERQLGEVQEELEAATSKLNVLKDRIAYSRVDIEMYQVTQLKAAIPPGIGTRLGDAFNSGFENILEVIIGLVHFWPFLLISSVGVVLYRTRKRKRAATT